MKKKKINNRQLDLLDISNYLSTAVCVPPIKEAVKNWRENRYEGSTKTSKNLLKFWFYTDHRLKNGNIFKYYFSQQQAIETLIYLSEVDKIKNRKELLEKYATSTKDLQLPPYDNFQRLCIKMATGSGKTKVMALAIAWQYFNAVRENDKEYAKDFLIIAPNVIVYDRLRIDFAHGNIFKNEPLFPKHFELFWDLNFFMKDDPPKVESSGNLYLTNIQQLFDKVGRKKTNEPEALTALLGETPDTSYKNLFNIKKKIIESDNKLCVLNDEAHHTHDEENVWNQTVRSLNKNKNLLTQLDFSATPRYSKGNLFSWTVFDYPLKQAIIDGIVKRPLKGVSRVVEAKSSISSVRYAGFLTAGVERWKEYNKQLKDLKKRPILFIMMNDTKAADEVGNWIKRKYPEIFGGSKTLIIHTDKSGEISAKDLEKSREIARNVDLGKSNVNAIVSVLMLREGWDVQNVTVVVGLRPYTAKANILPEQTIGRGLRLMFRGNTNYSERVDIIGNKAFLNFVEDLEKLEDLKLETFEIGKDKLKIVSVMPLKNKDKFDINIPEISPVLSRKKDLRKEIEALDINNFNIGKLPLEEKEIKDIKTFIYEGFDILTKAKELEREYTIPEAQTPEEVIGYYSQRISENIKLPSHFSLIAPKVREFFEKKAFGKRVDLNNERVIRAMSTNLASYVVVKEFEKKLKGIIVEEKVPKMLIPKRSLLNTNPFPFSKKIFEAKKTIFNYCACDNEYELKFAKFLDNSRDVLSFAKIPLNLGFCINYIDNSSSLRHYYPDFVVKVKDENYWLIETKGLEDVNVKFKDQAALLWCENITNLTDMKWNYLKVLQKEFENLYPSNFAELKTGTI